MATTTAFVNMMVGSCANCGFRAKYANYDGWLGHVCELLLVGRLKN
jgi:hypothetical protein